MSISATWMEDSTRTSCVSYDNDIIIIIIITIITSVYNPLELLTYKC